MILLRAANKYIDLTAPWVLAKDEANKETLRNVLYNLLEVIRCATIMLEVATPKAASKVYEALGVDGTNLNSVVFGLQKEYEVKKTDVLFQRLDVEEVMKNVLAKEAEKEKAEAKAKEEVKVEKEVKPEITIDDFDKLDLVVGKILEAKSIQRLISF